MNAVQEIQDLRRRKFNLGEKIRAYARKDKNAKKLVIELHEVTNRLNELGVKMSLVAPHYQLEYWENWEKSHNVTSTTPMQKVVHPKSSKDKPQKTESNNNFIICLAWTSLDEYPTPIQVERVKGYFSELGLKVEDEDSKMVNPGCTEYILKYEFEGSEESFRLLKTCTQFILDTFAESDFDRFNIAVYGKRKNY